MKQTVMFDRLFAAMVVLFLTGTSARATDTFLNVMPINSGWKFLRLDTPAAADTPALAATSEVDWKTVSLPHTAHLEPLVASPQWQGIAWYRYHLTTRTEWKSGEGKKVFLDVGAAMQVADVFINGKQVTTHFGGYLPFSVDLTDNLLPAGQDNVIAIRVDNRDNRDVPPGKPARRLDFNYYSGLYRTVSLRVVGPVYITDPIKANVPASGGLFVVTTAASPQKADVTAQLHVQNDNAKPAAVAVTFDLIDPGGVVVTSARTQPVDIPENTSSTITATLNVANPKLWHPDHPSLYSIRATVKVGDTVVDGVASSIGIRRVAITKDGGFKINGELMFLRGANRHQEYPFVGNALSDDAQYRDAVKLKESGFDYVRLSHYPQSPAFLDACDQLGIFVMEPIPGWQNVTPTELFKKRVVQDTRDMIRRDRNHPSVILWETSLNESPMDKALIASLQNTAREEFGNLAPDQFFSAGWKQGYDVFIESRQSGNLKKYTGAAPGVISEYGDWEYYSGNAGLNQEEFKDLKKPERSSRQSRGAPERLQLQQAVNFQEAANDNRSTIAFGDSVWVMFDYSRSFSKVLETSGPMDSLRLPKLSYYFFQSQRDPIAVPMLKDVRTGPMAFVASFWTKDSPLNIRVYSNCDEVELFLNDKSLGRQKPDSDSIATRLPHPPFTFKLKQFTPGTLKAVAYLRGARAATHSVRTPEAPATLRLRADLSGKPLTGDGADAIFLYADILDAHGTVVPTNDTPVIFTIKSSAGALIGGNPATAVSGIASLLLQAPTTASTLQIEATAPGLSHATLTVDALAPRKSPPSEAAARSEGDR